MSTVLRRVLWVLLAGGLAASVIAVLLVADPGAPVNGAPRLGYEVVFTTAGLLCLLRARTVADGRLPWTLLGCAVLVAAAADCYRLLWPPTSIPSVPDVGFLAFYPLTYVGLVLLVRARSRRYPATSWLDGMVVGLGLATGTAALAYGPLSSAGGEQSTAALAVTLAYPIGDLALLTIVGVMVVLLGQQPEPASRVLTVGFGLVSITDTLYLVQGFTGDGRVEAWVDLFWLAAAAMVPVAAWWPPAAVRPARRDGIRALLIPCLATLVAIAVLVVGAAGSVSPVATALATLTLLAVVARTVLTFRDVLGIAESRRQAVTDELTGLGNRRLFAERSVAALGPGRRGLTALLLVDLDRFKEVNDALGHAVGDELLRKLGPRLAGRLQPGETIARLGGDEFGVLVPGLTDTAEAEEAALRVAGALDDPLEVDGIDMHLSASIGIAVAPEHGSDGGVLLRKADVAMYEAKRTGMGQLLYTPAADRHTRERLETATDLRRALDRGELICYYQPQVDLATGLVPGVEALVRWAHPTRGLLVPAAFLSLAERIGLMRPLTEQVLRTALDACRAWEAAGSTLAVSVNLSAESMLDRRLLDRLAELLDASGLPPGRLVVEVTEGSLLGEPERVRQTMAALRELGVEVSIDDYGVGYSSLAYLRNLPVDELKLDRQLVTPVARDRRATAIVGSTVDLAHALGVRLVAEGVEDEVSLRTLAKLGCDRAQGYHLARPMHGDAVAAWTLAWQSGVSPGGTLVAPGGRPAPG